MSHDHPAMAAGSPDSEVRACSGVADWTANDADPSSHSGATEACDLAGRGEDCDPTTEGFLDAMATARACAPQPAL